MDTTSSVNKFVLPTAVILAGLLIAGAVVWNGQSPTPGDGNAKVNISDVQTAGEPFIGNPDAPTTIAFWSDFQCPFCKAFEVGHPEIPTPPAFPDIVRDYVDIGKVKLVFKDVVFLSPRMGQDSLTGALYNQAVWKLYPDKYLEWRTAMMLAQDEEGGGFGNAETIDRLNAGIAGLDATKIAADVEANRAAYERHANEVTAEAQRLGVNATPSLVIGTQLIAGAYPYDTFKSALETVVQ